MNLRKTREGTRRVGRAAVDEDDPDLLALDALDNPGGRGVKGAPVRRQTSGARRRPPLPEVCLRAKVGLRQTVCFVNCLVWGGAIFFKSNLTGGRRSRVPRT